MASMRVVAGCARALRNPRGLVARNSPLLSGKPISAMGGAGQQVRRLNVHEYVSMQIMAEHDIDIPASKMAETPEDAEKACAEIMGGNAMKDVVIKAQVLSGGRGRGHFDNGFESGVHMCLKPSDAKHYASEMLGQKLITKQTGEEGLPCEKVLLMERMYMRREMYLSIMMDRGSQGPVIVACPDGGTSIEDLAESNPELIMKEEVDIMTGLTDAQAGKIAEHLKLSSDGPSYEAGKTLLKNMYAMFIERDCTLVEINPLAETPEGRVMACDAKLNFDDNAEWRQKDTFQFRDYTQEDIREVEAAKYDLNYIGLTGNIGCMVNGAGLAMSTMDIIKLKGGDPANFLDVGGGATEEQVQKAFELLNADPKVATILVNIFGGIMRCDVIASGVINAAKSIGMKKPIVIRLQGTNVEQANELIANSGFKMIISNDLDDAAEKAVAVAEIYSQASKVGIDVELQAASA
ncbi:unnamed protein product [Ectocarpus sp. CCAP 1310/34]|nr:unnamed protein product [Ectocarpus sp. CCAP 1310/34]